MRLSLSAVLALGFLLPTTQGQSAPTPSPRIVLEDQFKRPKEITATSGDVVVLIYGDRNSVNPNRSLGSYLHLHFHPTARGLDPDKAQDVPTKPIPNWPAQVKMPSVRVIPVACVGKVPGIVATVLRAQIRRKSPIVPVYLDFDEVMQQAFGLAAKISNVVVLDTQGKVRYRASALYNRNQVAYLIQLIDSLRAEAKPTSTVGR